MFTLKEAHKLAIEVCTALDPYCMLLNIAGSIRREKPEVKDIELVVVPTVSLVGGTDLFGTTPIKKVVKHEFGKTIRSLGTILKGDPQTGRYVQFEYGKIKVDLFIPEITDYWRQFVIRTGSAEYVTREIATGWVRKGWCGSDMGLRLQKDCELIITPSGRDWKCKNINAQKPPHWKNEKEFYDWLGVKYTSPQNRH